MVSHEFASICQLAGVKFRYLAASESSAGRAVQIEPKVFSIAAAAGRLYYPPAIFLAAAQTHGKHVPPLCARSLPARPAARRAQGLRRLLHAAGNCPLDC